jgi:signal transduction histidine kinase/ligand-binding sensor domain-containing protein/CheY-like chemotaxis protein
MPERSRQPIYKISLSLAQTQHIFPFTEHEASSDRFMSCSTRHRLEPLRARQSDRLTFRLASIVFLTAALLGSTLGATPASGPAQSTSAPKPLSQYHHDVWETQHGLPQNSVKAMVLRRDGYLWLGTESGLVRFDGVRFVTFDRQSKPVLKDPDVTALFEDVKGDLWVGTEQGLIFRYARDEFVAVPASEPLRRAVRAFYQDKDGRLWIAAGNHVGRLEQDQFKLLQDSRANVYGFDEDGQGTLWVATGAGLARASDDRLIPDELTMSVQAVHFDAHGTRWLGTPDGLWRIGPRGERKHYGVANGLPSNDTRVLREDSQGVLWIGTAGGGLARLAGEQLDTFTAREGLSDLTVTALLEDHEDSIWIGTAAGGLNRLRAVPFNALTRQDRLPSNDVLSVYEDKESRLWIGTDGGGLTCIAPDRTITYTTQEGLPSNSVWTTWQASDGSIWAGTADRGLARFADGTWVSYSNRPEMPQGGIRAIYEDRGGALWIGNRDGLHRIRSGTITTFTKAQGLSSNNVSSIQEDQEGTLWIGTLEGGLNRMKDGKFFAYTTAEGLSTNDVSAIAVTGRYVWVGTFDGRLHLIRSDRALALPPRENQTNGRVLQILDDERGSLWVSTQRGITRYDQGDLLKVANGARPFTTPRVFDRLEGFGRWEFNGHSQTAGWRRNDGRLLFASALGAVWFDPTHFASSGFVPPVQIERVVSNDKDVLVRAQTPPGSNPAAGGPPASQAPDVELPPGQNQLELHYTALSLAVPERVQFRYRLEGVDHDWVDAGTRRVAYYTNVPGGRYRFQVIAANHDGVWNQTGATLGMAVQSRFTETYWFYGICGVVGLAGIIGVSRWRVRRLQGREKMLARLVEERTSALRQEVGERRRVESSLRQAKDVLEDRVRERTTELSAAYAQLQADVAERRRLEEQLAQVQKLESIGRLAGGVAHDLNNVLTVVLSYSDLLDTGLGPTHPLQAQLRQIRKAAERASNLTHRLLAFARQQVVEPRVINLSELSLSLDGMLRRLIGEDVELVTVASSGLWSVKADPHQIEQVLVNLVVNARDAMPTGGKLTIETANASVTEDDVRRTPTLTPGEYVRMTVSDTGVGMDEHVKKHLFEPFFTTKEMGKGTGLGLATCYGIVQQLGGVITVQTERGRGTTFTVYLPKVDQPATPTPKSDEQVIPRGTETVLLVEDEPLVRQIAESALLGQGYHVLQAENGEEALRVAAAHGKYIALVLTDVVMPRMGGRELTEQLRARRPGIRVLYMSGYAASTIDEQDVIEPGTAFLRKPFTLADMLRKVREVLDEVPVGRGV